MTFYIVVDKRTGKEFLVIKSGNGGCAVTYLYTYKPEKE